MSTGHLHGIEVSGNECSFLVPHSFKLFQACYVEQTTCRQEKKYLG